MALSQVLVGCCQFVVLDRGCPLGMELGLGSEVQQQDADLGHGLQLELHTTEAGACQGFHWWKLCQGGMGRIRSVQHGPIRLPLVPSEDVSYVDIYRALGNLEGKLDAVVQALNQHNRDFETALKRISELEKVVAKGLGVALTCSFVLPVVIGVAGTLFNARFHVVGTTTGSPPQLQHSQRP
jgi:hypothetical protein